GPPEAGQIPAQMRIFARSRIERDAVERVHVELRMERAKLVQAWHPVCLHRLLGAVEHEAQFADPGIAVKARPAHEHGRALSDLELAREWSVQPRDEA